MKEVYVVSFKKHGTNHVINDSVFKNLKDALDYVDQWNKWEESEEGQGDLWFYTIWTLPMFREIFRNERFSAIKI